MDRQLSVLLVEDDPNECQEIIKAIQARDDIALVGTTNNIIQAIQYVKDLLPDVIILDLELHKGYGNGLEFLSTLQRLNLKTLVYVLVTTNNISYITHESARKLGADFIMVKSQEDYTASSAIQFLCSLKNIILKNKKVTTIKDDSETYTDVEKRINKLIISELDKVGVPPNAVGRKYLIDSISMLVKNKSVKIYKAVSDIYLKSESSVERAMQNAIEKAWKSTHIDDLQLHYTARIRSSKGVPTITEFIYYYAEKIKNEY